MGSDFSTHGLRRTNSQTCKSEHIHLRNKHKGTYDLEELSKLNPDLHPFVFKNEYGKLSIDFSNAKAVKELNKALLHSYYSIDWDLPSTNLCPPIPGRADYIHSIAEFLESKNINHNEVNCLDIGTGASLIYPIIGICEYGWRFIASDINKKSIQSAKNILVDNTPILNEVELRLQKNPDYIFRNILRHNDKLDIVICNPPFYSSEKEAELENLKKVKNLNKEKIVSLNFSGQSNELVCKGGELEFISNMIRESKMFKKQIRFCSSLVSKKNNLEKLIEILIQTKVSMYEVLPISHGNKKSRVLIWSFY